MRAQAETATGRDLSDVRVDTSDEAAEMAAQHNARAYAEGNTIYFAKGEYQPGTPKGDKLILHEIAHVAQQQGAAAQGAEPGAPTQPGDRAEKNADQAASAMAAGRPAEVTAEPVQVARKRNDEAIDAPAPVETAKGPDGNADGKPEGAAEAKTDGKTEGKDGAKAGEEEIGELSAERVGQTEDEGEDAGPIGPPQDLEGGKADIAGKASAMPQSGGAEELATGAPKGDGPKGDKGDAGGAGGAGGEVELSPELQASISAAQSDAQEASNQAKTEANAYKGEMKERRDRFDAEQNALTLEQVKTMSPADKRSTLVEMGYDQKKVKKMKDAELDGIITGKLETEQRKTKILGMDPEELAALSPAQKAQFLVDNGMDKKDVDKIGQAKAAKAFDDIMRVAHTPGQHKVKVKVKGGLLGKSWEFNIKVDAEGGTDIEAKKKGGFLSKLWGWVKAALPIILTVIAPLTGGASLVVLAVYQTVTAIATGDWLGAIVGAAGAFVGLGALSAIKNGAGAAASAFRQIASVAGKVKKVADAAKAAMLAAKAKSPGSLLAALATGASGFADFASNSAGKFAETMTRWSERLDKWSKVVSGGEKVVAGIKSGDPGAAIGGAFDAAAALVSKPEKKTDDKGNVTEVVETSKAAKDLQRYSRMAGYASAGQRAAKGKPPDYGAVVDAAMGIAGELKTSKRLEDATKITNAASRLTRAIQTNDPSQLAAAAIQLAEAIQLAKYDADNPAEKDEAGNTLPDADRDKITDRYKNASSVVKFASTALSAATAKPRPNYIGALDAASQLIADLTASKKLDQAALLTSKFDAWTKAVQSKDEAAIIRAGEQFGQAINGMRTLIQEERDAAKKAAEAKLAPGETLGDDGGNLPSVAFGEVVPLKEGVAPQGPGQDEGKTELGPDGDPIAIVSTSEEFRLAVGPRESTPGANYTVIGGDTLSGIARRFNTTVAELRSRNPQLASDRIYLNQRLFVPGADVALTPSVTTSISDVRVAGEGGKDGEGAATDDKKDGSSGPILGIPKELEQPIAWVRALGSVLAYWDHPGLDELFNTWDAWVKTEEKLRKAGQSNMDAYRSAVQNLKTVTQTLKWGEVAAQELSYLRGRFGDPLSEAAQLQAKANLDRIEKFRKGLEGIPRMVGLPLAFMDAANNLPIIYGWKANGQEATEVERLQAAYNLYNAVNGIRGSVAKIPGDITWLGTNAQKVISALAGKVGKYVPAVVTTAANAAGNAVKDAATRTMAEARALAAPAVASVRNAASKLGAQSSAIVMKYVTPILEKAAQSGGAEAANKIASAMAKEVGEYALKIGARLSRSVFLTITQALGAGLIRAVAFGLSTPGMIAFEIAKLEAEFAAELYQDAYSSISMVMSARAFGKQANVLKREVRAKSFSDHDSANQFFGYILESWLGGAAGDIRASWRMFSLQKLASGSFPTQYNQLYANPLQFLRGQEEYMLKFLAASKLQDLAIQFVNEQYQKIFGEAPAD